MTTITCCKCKRDLPANADYFHCDSKRRQGFSNRCKECWKLYRKAHYNYEMNFEYKKRHKNKLGEEGYKRQIEMQRFNWYYRLGGKERRKSYHLAYSKTEKAKELHRLCRKRDYENNKDKQFARSTVGKAVYRGKIPPATALKCHYCGNDAKHYHHWQGYEKKSWLDVVPVCISCHVIQDKFNGHIFHATKKEANAT